VVNERTTYRYLIGHMVNVLVSYKITKSSYVGDTRKIFLPNYRQVQILSNTNNGEALNSLLQHSDLYNHSWTT